MKMRDRDPTGIRDKILNKTYRQVCKLLNPSSKELDIHHSKEKRDDDKKSDDKKNCLLTDDEKRDLLTTDEQRVLAETGGAIVEYVQMGSFPLEAYTRLTRLPAIYIANGTEPEETSARNSALGTSNLDSVFEVYPLTLRIVVHQEFEPKYEDSNPVQLAAIREQLDYFLDMQAFGGITDKRFGYKTPSRVYRALITTTQTLKGIASPWEIVDLDFEVIFQKQYARDAC